jgi:hypothetical protein
VNERLEREFGILGLLLAAIGVLAIIWLELGFDMADDRVTAVHLKGLLGVAILGISARCGWHARRTLMGRAVLAANIILVAIAFLGGVTFALVSTFA